LFFCLNPIRATPFDPCYRRRRQIKRVLQNIAPLQGNPMIDLLPDMPDRTEAETRLFDPFAAFESDDHFRGSLRLLKTITDCHSEVIDRLYLYLCFAKDESLRVEIRSEIERRENPDTERAKKTKTIETEKGETMIATVGASDRLFIRLIGELARPSTLATAIADACQASG